MGVLIGLSIIMLWLAHLIYLFSSPLSWTTLQSYLHLAVQGYLTTGLFITAHDAMHGSVSSLRWLNHAIGACACWLFGAMSYRRLLEHHKQHHAAPATATDPDFHVKSQNFWVWFAAFLFRYATVPQILTMAALYNLFERVFFVPESRIWLFWILPCAWGALQLFYFGTYQPHKLPLTDDMHPYAARTLKRNHLWAMLSCYFFGYHWEHHHSPATPWWKLWRLKDALQKQPI
ncbi:MAG: fatty acid desaturase [[Chlorobium] sp. 445]|nr:MAG: fatty acid desaturase [[Chlorobium] sp. 445]